MAQNPQPQLQPVSRTRRVFERKRGGDPDFLGWDECVKACAGGSGG